MGNSRPIVRYMEIIQEIFCRNIAARTTFVVSVQAEQPEILPAVANRSQPIRVAPIHLARATSGQEFSHSPHRRFLTLQCMYNKNQRNCFHLGLSCSRAPLY
jgi:hypothetical protein